MSPSSRSRRYPPCATVMPRCAPQHASMATTHGFSVPQACITPARRMRRRSSTAPPSRRCCSCSCPNQSRQPRSAFACFLRISGPKTYVSGAVGGAPSHNLLVWTALDAASMCQNEVVADLKQRGPSVDQLAKDLASRGPSTYGRGSLSEIGGLAELNHFRNHEGTRFTIPSNFGRERVWLGRVVAWSELVGTMSLGNSFPVDRTSPPFFDRHQWERHEQKTVRDPNDERCGLRTLPSE
jgi:hypothetical protein